jgi:hypothetical protein
VIPKTPGAFISGPFMPREAKGHGERQGVGEVIQHRDHLPPESFRANTLQTLPRRRQEAPQRPESYMLR